MFLNLENMWLDLLRRTEDEYELWKERESRRTLPKRADTLFSTVFLVSYIDYIKSKTVFSAKSYLSCEIWFQNLFWKNFVTWSLEKKKVRNKSKQQKPQTKTLSQSANISAYSDNFSSLFCGNSKEH